MTSEFIMGMGGLLGFVGFAIWGLVKYVLKDDDITNKEIEEGILLLLKILKKYYM